MKVITCFSYKGGAGRTVAAANIAAALASMQDDVGAIRKPLKRKVAILDLDVFSAGTHRVFGIGNRTLAGQLEICVQQYLRDDILPSHYIENGGVTLANPLMRPFRETFSATGNCEPSFTLFPANPIPGDGWVVQKLHENILFDLVQELEARKFDYLIIDGENGTRSMAEIALRLADVALAFFRLTWQHVEGTMSTVEAWENRKQFPQFYLIPTCVPLVAKSDHVYLESAPGLDRLREQTEEIPKDSGLDEYAEVKKQGPGYFWSTERRMCIHDSLVLKGGERIVVFRPEYRKDNAAMDYYQIAAELDRKHGPGPVSTPEKKETSPDGSR